MLALFFAADYAQADDVLPDKVRPGNLSPYKPGIGQLYEPEQDGTLLAAMDLVYRMQYSAADSVLSGLPDRPARDYFRGLVEMNRFGDLGDTSALSRAKSLWENLDRASDGSNPRFKGDGNYPLYRGLAVLQLSYVASVSGSPIGSARLGRKAVGLLRPLAEKAEAEAALALYEYYKASLLKGVAWMPFVDADRAEPLRQLEAAIPRSRYLGEILQTSLLWLYYDAGLYQEGLARIDAFLSRYPENRPYRQIRADFFYRNGDMESARAIHQSLLAEYKDLGAACPFPACLPLGYLASVGNLAKIHATLKQPELLGMHLEIWRSSEFAGVMKWMPASLKREVASLKI